MPASRTKVMIPVNHADKGRGRSVAAVSDSAVIQTAGMSMKYIRMGDLPREFLDLAMREFVPYSVALGRIRGENASTFVPLGSGTLVQRKGLHGILTARHCLHACTPKVRIGTSDGDTFALVLRGARSLIVRPEQLVEHRLAVPVSEEFGPDLTFIEILPGEILDTFKAIGSFWSLDHDPVTILGQFGEPGTVLAFIGFPAADYETVIEGNDIRHKVTHMTYLGVIQPGGAFVHVDWDYLESTVDYGECAELPASFGGLNGGPIWGMRLAKHEKDGSFSIESSALVGVAYYETAMEGERRRLRSHFIRSIYELAWRQKV